MPASSSYQNGYEQIHTNMLVRLYNGGKIALGCHRSMGMVTITHTTLIAHRITPNQQANSSDTSSARPGLIRLVDTDPSLAMDKFTPKANASSVP
jgi:hypothetical protein